jgi:hypothetical protein
MSRILLVTFSGCKFGISKVVCNWDLDSCCYRVSVFFFAVISDWCIFFCWFGLLFQLGVLCC